MPDANASFSTAQRQELNDIIGQAIVAALEANAAVRGGTNNNGSGNNGGSAGNGKNGATMAVPQASTSTHWRADEIGLFDPHLDKSHEDGEIITVGKDVYY